MTAPDSSVTDYVFDDLGPLESYAGSMIDPTSDGSFVYARSPSGRVLAQQDPASGIARLVGLNRHGDLSYLFDSSGVVSDSRVYDPFGDEAAETGTTNSTWVSRLISLIRLLIMCGWELGGMTAAGPPSSHETRYSVNCVAR